MMGVKISEKNLAEVIAETDEDGKALGRGWLYGFEHIVDPNY